MPARGPSSGMSGYNIKGKQRQNYDFDNLLETAGGDDEGESLEDFLKRQKVEQQQQQPMPTEQPEMTEEELAEMKALTDAINNGSLNINTDQQEEQVDQQYQQQPQQYQPQPQQQYQPQPQRPRQQQPQGKILRGSGVNIQSFVIDPSKPFNQQQPRKITNQVKVTEMRREEPEEEIRLNKKKPLSLEKEDYYENDSYDEDYNEDYDDEEDEDDDFDDSVGRSGRGSRNKKTAKKGKGSSSKKSGKASKQKASKEKTKSSKGKSSKKKSKNIDEELENGYVSTDEDYVDEKLRKKGFPKEYYDPTDAEADPQSGEVGYYFNIEKTLRKHNMLWIGKIIPISTLDRLTFDKPFFDNYALKQHYATAQLNELSAQDQYKYEKRKKTKKFLISAAAVLLVVMYVLFGAIPKSNYKAALELYQQQNWEQAYNAFTALGAHKNSQYYGKYSEAMFELQQKKYDEAKEDFNLLVNYQEYFETPIEDNIKECDYQKAVYYYLDNDFDNAMKIFASIPDYKDSAQYYYQCGYAVGESFEEAGDQYGALDAYYRVSTDEKAKAKLISIASAIYDNGMNNYNLKQYQDALTDFAYLTKYNYQDSRAMVEQCYYREGLDKYNAGDYAGARDLFSKVLSYKDSNAMLKECTYRIAKGDFASSIEESLKEYSNIPTYRDVPTLLQSGAFLPYGEWTITEMNHSKTTPVDFKFNVGGLFQTTKSVLYVAISTDANPIKYSWDGEKYVTADGQYSLSATPNGTSSMILTCKAKGPDGNEQTAEFTCERKASYLTMLSHNTSGGDIDAEEQEEQTTADTVTEVIQRYVDKKTDGTVVIGDKELNSFLIIQQINSNLGNS